jgi:predicted nicotinamide N-methyase
MHPEAEAFIRANLPVLPVPSIPEIRLHKAGPRSGLGRLDRMDEAFRAPYWAHHWAGGLALARFLLDHPAMVAGRRVLDLGAGSGIVGIAAARAGARDVLAAEVDPYAIAALQLNATLNRVRITPVAEDLTAGDAPAVDLVAVGDLFYEAGLAAAVTAFLDRCLGAGITVLVGDPGRRDLPRSRLRLQAEYPVPDFGDAPGGAAKPAGVFAFIPAGE